MASATGPRTAKAFDVGTIRTEEQTVAPQAIVNGNGTASTAYLDGLRKGSMAAVKAIGDHLTAMGLKTELNSKAAAAAETKALRPETLDKYPWFTIAHVRDYLRFRTYLQTTADFVTVLKVFQDFAARGTIEFVKIDTRKLNRPGPFGWQMLSTDLRVSETGLIIEHYMTFGDLIEVNQQWLHEVYEAWRDKDVNALNAIDLAALHRDMRFSSHAYRELFLDGVGNSPGGASLAAARTSNAGAIIQLLQSELTLR